MTDVDPAPPRLDLFQPLDVEAFCAAIGIPVDAYMETAAAIAAKFPGVDVPVIEQVELDRLRAVAAAARTLRVETFGRAQNDEDIEAAWDALREALDEIPA